MKNAKHVIIEGMGLQEVESVELSEIHGVDCYDIELKNALESKVHDLSWIISVKRKNAIIGGQ